MSKQRPAFVRYLYCLAGIAFLVYSTYIVFILVMHIWHHAPHGEAHADSLSKEDRLYQEMLKGVDAQNAGLAYKDIGEIHKLYDFHKNEAKAVTDSKNLCVSCHGDVPHDKKKEIRAFLNMHAYFMACETCHIKSETPGDHRYVWYNKVTGDEKSSIDTGFFLEDTPYKLMPLNRGGEEPRVFDTGAMVKYVGEFKSKVGEMVPAAKSASLKVIHRPMSSLENSVKCNECHNSNINEAYLPLREIGYNDRRMAQIVGNEVAGMIDRYKEFYIPSFLKPSEEK
ncbi:MAG TPA: cytochrome C [Deferribacteraceae bacterium]|nr:cytochrome C [Deferribacteraceae bacterium]